MITASVYIALPCRHSGVVRSARPRLPVRRAAADARNRGRARQLGGRCVQAQAAHERISHRDRRLPVALHGKVPPRQTGDSARVGYPLLVQPSSACRQASIARTARPGSSGRGRSSASWPPAVGERGPGRRGERDRCGPRRARSWPAGPRRAWSCRRGEHDRCGRRRAWPPAAGERGPGCR